MLENIEKLYNEPLSKHTSFKIGGEAKVVYFPSNRNEFVELISSLTASGERYIIIGNGSNILFDDKGTLPKR